MYTNYTRLLSVFYIIRIVLKLITPKQCVVLLACHSMMCNIIAVEIIGWFYRNNQYQNVVIVTAVLSPVL